MSRSMAVRLIWPILGIGLFCVFVVGSEAWNGRDVHAARPPVWEDLPSVRGTLRVTTFGSGAAGASPTSHVSVYVNGRNGYGGMEDNDLRGFLDGAFKWGWNQPDQVHVRIGRRGEAPAYGEHELFRVIQRWSGIELPPGAVVDRARLSLVVEKGPAHPVRVVLYAVKNDWNPGNGGIERNSTSPPMPGEVWWNDVGYEERPWGLPGAGFASDTHPEADTDAMPLAETIYRPGDPVVELSSARLARYATQRIREGLPLLLLLKLADTDEDVPGSVLTVYAGEHGATRDLGRRPRLELEWRSSAETRAEEYAILLEHGRSLTLPRMRGGADASHVFIEFDAEPGHADPVIEVRGGAGGNVTPWQRAGAPIPSKWEWLEVRLTAAADPVVLGEAFTAELRDTWVTTGPPEEQRVIWTFVSPTGVRHDVPAEYVGDNTWKVEFFPDELGRWHYEWSQHFTDEGYRSAVLPFDVLIGSRENALMQVERFAQMLEQWRPEPGSPEHWRWMVRFARIERAAMQLETPETYRSAAGLRLRELLNRSRAILGNGPPPPIPQRPDAPRP